MKTLITATMVALSISASAMAQAPNAAGAKAKEYGIAVVDVGYIFKNHQGFLARMESMKGEVSGIEQQLEADRQNIVKMEQGKANYKPGTPEYSQMDDKIATARASFQLKMQKMQKEFLAKEAKVYYDTYQEVSQMITNYARYQKIGLVLRFNGEPADPLRRETVLREINKPVQFHDSIDITPDILALLNRNAPQNPAAPTSTAGRPGMGPQ